MKNLKDYILVVENAIPSFFCDEIVAYYEVSDEWDHAKIGGNPEQTNEEECSSIDKSKRNCTEIHLTESIFEKHLFKIAKNCLKRYLIKHPDARTNVGRGEAFSILKYEPDGFYKEHIDADPMAPRVLSLSIVLNDEFTGGEFCFSDGNHKINLKKGSAIMFPSNFMYKHQVLPVKSGTRYSIVTWFN